MAHFYASVQGNRGEVHRLGSKASGMTATVASYAGAVTVSITHDPATGRDMVKVALAPWKGSGISRELYAGPVDDPGDRCPLARDDYARLNAEYREETFEDLCGDIG